MTDDPLAFSTHSSLSAAPAATDAPATFAVDGLTAYFQSKRAGVDAHLVSRLTTFIAATQESLDCAIYDLRHPAILQALIQVAQRGKRLRIAFDGGAQHSGGLSADPKPDGTQQAIEAAGLAQYATAVHERGRHLMHDKFLVRDGRSLWTGSANFTVGGLELQDNNCLAIESPQFAASYTAVFEGLLTGATKQSPHGGAPVTLGATSITPFFAPAASEGIENALVAALKQAKRVRVFAFLISDPGVLDALAPYANEPQFDIRGVYDPNGMRDVLRYTSQDEARFWFTKDSRFVAAPTHAFSPAHEQDFMHNKVIVVDDRLVFTGSYNFSENAEANDENLLAIQSPAVAAAYTAYFHTLWAMYSRPHAMQSLLLPEVAFTTFAIPAAATSTASTPFPSSATAASLTGSDAGQVKQPLRQLEEMPMTAPESSHAAQQLSIGPRPHVLAFSGRGSIAYEAITLPRSRQQFRGEAEVGQTAHVIVYTDGTPQGDQSAQAVLQTAEADYTATQQWFGGLDLPQGQQGDDQTTPRTALPLQVLMDGQAGGAYHFGCNATDIYIEPAAQAAQGFWVAELIEVFQAAINNGWACGQTNGEALSRVLAAERSSAIGQLQMQTGQKWWSDGHADYVASNSATDQDEDSNGCGPLFLYYLHSQLGYDWQRIVTTGGATLGETYQRLTGNAPQQGFNDFISRLATIDNNGTLNLPQSGNPFPIGQTTTPAPSGDPSGQGALPVPALPNVSGGGPNYLITAIIVVIIVLILVAAIGAQVVFNH
ncbi:MAG: phospholipase D-like domain-containing protein [Ktedonobacterales bacterium]